MRPVAVDGLSVTRRIPVMSSPATFTRAMAADRAFVRKATEVGIELVRIADQLELMPQASTDMHRLQVPVSHLAKADDRRVGSLEFCVIPELTLHQREGGGLEARLALPG